MGALVVLILILDQWLKIYIKSNFAYGEVKPIFGDWFRLEYVENPGMAFGTKFGSAAWHKLALSIFRIIAIAGIVYYMVKQFKAKVKFEFMIALGLILAGAAGNLFDSMFYDFIFPFDGCKQCNWLEGSGNFAQCGPFKTEIRHTGFLMANVVDMFHFNAQWPQWVPIIGGWNVFPAIWNLADASISIGIIMVLIRQKAYFPKKKEEVKIEEIKNPE